jgi:hypothetical protein
MLIVLAMPPVVGRQAEHLKSAAAHGIRHGGAVLRMGDGIVPLSSFPPQRLLQRTGDVWPAEIGLHD